jgi:hypothetical protein
MMGRDEVINKAIEKLSKLTSEDFHGYRSEIWIVLGEVYDSGENVEHCEHEWEPCNAVQCENCGLIVED